MLVVLLQALITACKPNGLILTDAWARPGSVGGNNAVFFRIENQSYEADSLIDVKCNSAEQAEIHRSTMDEGVMKMEYQENVAIPPRGSIRFEPGRYHIMLVNLENDLNNGDTISLTLVFDNAGELIIEIPVEDR